MMTINEKRKRCEAAFDKEGPYFHAYTSGKDTPILFTCKKDMAFAMNVIAQTSYQYPGIRILAFEVMNNHFHFILSGDKDECLAFCKRILKRIRKHFPDAVNTSLSIKNINDLATLRNNITYVNRNGYAADPNHTPFSYPWGTGRYYFLDEPAGIPVSWVTCDELRKLLRCRVLSVSKEWLFVGCLQDWLRASGATWSRAGRGIIKQLDLAECYISPASYCDINLGMSMFRDAHHYFQEVTKNIEAYSELALEIGDNDFLTDTELFAKLGIILKERYGNAGVRNLTNAQKLDIARMLHYDYRSSNGQIRRLLGLSQYDVDSLFPLSQH
ncbi:MAG: hypothetical protein ACI4UJ_03040 [Candidatus Cryptobacteroides sp.]